MIIYFIILYIRRFKQRIFLLSVAGVRILVGEGFIMMIMMIRGEVWGVNWPNIKFEPSFVNTFLRFFEKTKVEKLSRT